MSVHLSKPEHLSTVPKHLNVLHHLCHHHFVTSIPLSLVQLKQPALDPSLILQPELNESPPSRSSTHATLLQRDWLPVERL